MEISVVRNYEKAGNSMRQQAKLSINYTDLPERIREKETANDSPSWEYPWKESLI